MNSAPPFTTHPCLPELGLPHILQFAQANQCSAEAAWQRIEHERREAIRKAKADPYRHGFELPWWKDADALIDEPGTTLLANLGGNGSAKTTRMVKRGVQVAFNKPGAKVLFLHEDEKASIDVHQGMAYNFLPVELKPKDGVKIKRTVSTNIQYEKVTAVAPVTTTEGKIVPLAPAAPIGGSSAAPAAPTQRAITEAMQRAEEGKATDADWRLLTEYAA